LRPAASGAEAGHPTASGPSWTPRLRRRRRAAAGPRAPPQPASV